MRSLPHTTTTIRMEELLGSRIVTSEGKRIGHVIEIQVTRGPVYKVVELLFGRYAWLYHLHILHPLAQAFGWRAEPEHIPWEAVERVEHSTVTLKPGYDTRQQGSRGVL